jgi:hypothetical protein
MEFLLRIWSSATAMFRNLYRRCFKRCCVLGLTSILAGCSHQLCLQIVDARDGKPLPNIRVTWREDRDQMFAKPASHGPLLLETDGKDGIIRVKCHRNWVNQFQFLNENYIPQYGIYGSGRLSLSHQKQDLDNRFSSQPRGRFVLKGQLSSAVSSNGCFLVPLERQK